MLLLRCKYGSKKLAKYRILFMRCLQNPENQYCNGTNNEIFPTIFHVNYSVNKLAITSFEKIYSESLAE